jgi:hypothetical protein
MKKLQQINIIARTKLLLIRVHLSSVKSNRLMRATAFMLWSLQIKVIWIISWWPFLHIP